MGDPVAAFALIGSVSELIRVGTRRSPLALAQTEAVLAELRRKNPDARFEAVPTDTSGDRDRTLGGSPDFTDAIDRLLVRGDVDLAVHSAKDVSVELDPHLELAACPPRADPRDCLVLASATSGGRLPSGTRIGSSSLRRRAQLLRWRPDLKVVEIRGNVDTRIGLVQSHVVDAAILAVAGLSRLGRHRDVGRVLPTSRFLPSPGQGALAVVLRTGDSALRRAVRRIGHSPTLAAVVAERAFAAALGGDCNVPLGALAQADRSSLVLTGEVLSVDGQRRLRSRRSGATREASRVGSILGRALFDLGAPALWAPLRG